MAEEDLRILVVDDERAIRRFLTMALNSQGYTVVEAVDGESALQAVVMQRPDLLILDLGLPDMDGIEVVRRLREWSELPILILSVREQEADKIAALDAGADDYLTKPFRVGELLARLRAALRRVSSPTRQSTFLSQGLCVDLAHRQVTMHDQEVHLTPTEYDLLRVFILHAGKVLTHRYLLRQVWGPAYEAEVPLLRVNISNLRQKLEPDPTQPQYLITEKGVGYRLVVA
jgi:two-component system KDP operon response regulator KdpE